MKRLGPEDGVEDWNLKDRSVQEYDILFELGQLEDTTDGANVETKQHASEACRSSHGKRTPSVDLRRVGLDGIVLDYHANDSCAGGNHDGGSFKGQLHKGVLGTKLEI
jgi:hypothetical protein